MDITPLIPTGKKILNSYGSGKFTISGEKYTGHVIITPNLVTEWIIDDLNQLTVSDFALLPKTDLLSILLIGCGTEHKLISRELRSYLRNLGYMAEPMQTAAASRTYNILLAEDRNVMAALIAV